ncbi:hypothetical protein [Streptomyces africanus]|uniref:hypothetical protein n=1 Tax=Streptomyces africanus TaxID=231024 RepID=UPI000A367D27|nr:hypothetical protein [Streptomyces africanus]
MSNLDIHSEKRGEWHVVTVPAGIRVTVYSLPNKKAAVAARDAIAAGVPDFPWGVDKDGLKAAVGAFVESQGMPLGEAVTRALAAVPAADPGGWNRISIESMDASRAAHRAFIERENADGYTELVKVSDIETGDEISFKYTVTRTRYGFTGMAPLGKGPGSARTVVVRATVTGEGRVMTRSGNNYDEGVSGLRFPLTDATWTDENGSSGPLEAAVTVDWLAGVRRRPRKG